VHSPSSDAPLARLEQDRDELAKSWLQGIIDRTPLEQVGGLPVDWIAREAPALIGDILGELTGTAPLTEPGTASAAQTRLAELSSGRSPPAAVHRDLAALQALLIDALRREIHERERFARAAQRLAEIFGSMQATLGESMLGEGGARRDELTGLGGAGELHECLRRLVAGYERYGHPFAVLSIDIEGLGRVNEAHGREAGDRMLEAVAATLVREIRTVDYAFRLTDDDFCVIAPHHSASGARSLAERLRGSLDGSPSPGSARVSLAVGIASCPDHAESAVRLLDAAQEATYAAKASGGGVAIANGISISPGDPSVRNP